MTMLLPFNSFSRSPPQSHELVPLHLSEIHCFDQLPARFHSFHQTRRLLRRFTAPRFHVQLHAHVCPFTSRSHSRPCGPIVSRLGVDFGPGSPPISAYKYGSIPRHSLHQIRIAMVLCLDMETLEGIVEGDDPIVFHPAFWSIEALLSSCESRVHHPPLRSCHKVPNLRAHPLTKSVTVLQNGTAPR